MNKGILVIDDDESVRKSFVLALEDIEEYVVDTVESGEKGLERLKGQRYDLIFLDLKMPGMNGVETLKKIRRADKNVPVYIVTAFHREFFDQLKAEAEDGLNFELVKKPMDIDRIILVVKSVFGQSLEI